VSERQWGTVREDYSADGDAWTYLPHDHARSRAYRWGEDGLAGFCDIEQRLCLALALWNGRDPILKERAFGLTGTEGNHGEDVKEYWWYRDALPSHAWNSWRYHYPQRQFPYQQLLDENRRRGKFDCEYELLDTGVFDDGYWVVNVHYVKADPTDILMTISVTKRRAGNRTAAACCRPCGTATPGPGMSGRPRRRWLPPPPVRWRSSTPSLATSSCWLALPRRAAGRSCCFATMIRMLLGCTGLRVAHGGRKDGINDHVVSGADTVNPQRRGSKCAAWYQVTVAPGATAELRLRLRRAGTGPDPATALDADFTRLVDQRRAEADEFYAELTPAAASADEAAVMRQGVRRHAVEQAVLLLRGGPLARRRPDPAAPPRAAEVRPQRPLAQLRGVRRDVDGPTAGSIRGLRRGTWHFTASRWCTSIRRSRSISCCCCAASGFNTPTGRYRIRVGFLRRQPPRACLGGAGGVWHRRRPRLRFPQPDFRQAVGQLHLVG